MTKAADGTVHKTPDDLASALEAAHVIKPWNELTPLGRNEFVCWVISPKKIGTRKRRIARTIDDLRQGERRPCCWIGCIHRDDKHISPSVRGILEKRGEL